MKIIQAEGCMIISDGSVIKNRLDKCHVMMPLQDFYSIHTSLQRPFCNAAGVRSCVSM